MYGYPKHINSKEDVFNILREFPSDPRNITFLRSLISDRFEWFNLGEITSAGITDETHKVVIDKDMITGGEKKYQYQLLENPAAKIFRLGFPVEEIESLIQE